MALSSNLSLTDLISKLSGALKLFAKDMREIVDTNEMRAPTDDIRELMQHIRVKSVTDPKEKEEIKKTLTFLKQLTDDELLLQLIKTESEDWYELITAIEERMLTHADKLGPGETEIYKETINALDKIKGAMRRDQAK
jgi:hypothetical protein